MRSLGVFLVIVFMSQNGKNSVFVSAYFYITKRVSRVYYCRVVYVVACVVSNFVSFGLSNESYGDFFYNVKPGLVQV